VSLYSLLAPFNETRDHRGATSGALKITTKERKSMSRSSAHREKNQ
jgi:hypothetical protein